MAPRPGARRLEWLHTDDQSGRALRPRPRPPTQLIQPMPASTTLMQGRARPSTPSARSVRFFGKWARTRTQLWASICGGTTCVMSAEAVWRRPGWTCC